MKYISQILLAIATIALVSCEPTEVGTVDDYKKYDPEVVDQLAGQVVVNVKELSPQIYEVEYLRGEGGEDVNAIPFITWDFGNGETSQKDKDTIYYTYPGVYNLSFNGYTYDGELVKDLLTVDAKETLECNIGKTIDLDNFDDATSITGTWLNKNKNDTPLFDEYHVDSNPYTFPEGNNVMLIGKAGGWWTEVAYDLDSPLDFSANGLTRKVKLRFYVPSKFDVPEGNFDFNIPENYLNLRLGLKTSGNDRQEIERVIKLTELDQWIEVEFDYTDSAFDKVDPTEINEIWVMFTHQWDADRGAGRDGTGVIMIDDIQLIEEAAGCL